MIVASAVVFYGVLRLALRSRPQAPAPGLLALVALIVVVGGMSFAKIGATSGWPIWLYYGVPAVLTWILPPVVFRMARRELIEYIVLAVVMAPAIHIVFSLLLGWKEFMPFIPVPSLRELL